MGIRLGLCCIFHNVPSITYRTATATHVAKLSREAALTKLSDLCLHNAYSLRESIKYCALNGIGSFRATSGLCPLITHPILGYALEELPGYAVLSRLYAEVKAIADSLDIRRILHPDPFCVLNSPKTEVVESCLRELSHHNEIANLIGVDVINIHGGGMYGDRTSALQRLEANVSLLSDDLRSKLTFENDDKTFTVNDLMSVCVNTGIPLVLDIHHDRCNPCGLSVEDATNLALSTWHRNPLFHISSSKTSAKPREHSDYINVKDFPVYWLKISESLDLTVEIEAKYKESAIFKLQEELLQ